MILANDPHGAYGPASISIFNRWLPQLSQSTPFVHAASAAFGAAYNFVLVTNGDSGAERLSDRLYGQALHMIQQEVQVARTVDLAPLLLSCILLAAAESVQQRQRNALSHVLGAFSMLHMTSKGSLLPPEMSADTSTDVFLEREHSIGRCHRETRTTGPAFSRRKYFDHANNAEAHSTDSNTDGR